MQYIIAYISTIFVILTVDYVWLAILAKDFYKSQLSHLMMNEVNTTIAALFYLMYAVGILIFAVVPALQNDSWKHALLYGALFGFFAYATYDLTNMATLKDWPVLMSFVDVAWGTFVTSLAATGGFFITKYIFKLVG